MGFAIVLLLHFVTLALSHPVLTLGVVVAALYETPSYLALFLAMAVVFGTVLKSKTYAV